VDEKEFANGDSNGEAAEEPPSSVEFLEEVSEQRRITADPSRPLQERLDVFEDIMESQVGDTTFVRARNLERETGLRQLFLKFEGGNPTGTHKDRIAFIQVMDALRRGFDTIALATCGNYGAAVSLAAKLAGIRCVIFVPGRYHTRRMGEMARNGAVLRTVDGDYEEALRVSSQVAEKEEWYDANPGGLNTLIQLNAYGGISYEIYDELRDAPYLVALPVSNGTTLAGVYRGFMSLNRRGKTSRMPRVVAGSSHKKNPIVEAFVKNKAHCEDLVPQKIHETWVNEPLINWHAVDGDMALAAIRSTGGWATNVSDKMMRHYAKMISDCEGINVLPASTAGLIALAEAHKKDPLPNDRFVVLMTGRFAK
jgi:threonine synthase